MQKCNYLLSSSTIITRNGLVSPIITSLGNNDASIIILKYTFPWYTSLLIIVTSKEVLVVPAVDMTEYGPES